jgi:hypothetical protein
MGTVVFFRRSCAYRSAAGEMIRKARAMPPGSERRAIRQRALAFRDLARTEAWLEGQIVDQVASRGAGRGSFA